MAGRDFDLVIIGAGSGGLTAAGFAARLGARVALVEKNRIGGDCTWTGCIPSKALLKVAKVAHEVRSCSRFGIVSTPPVTDMKRVREYLRQSIHQVYQFESPEVLREKGIEVIHGSASFLDASTVSVGHEQFRSNAFLITTGARPRVPAIPEWNDVPFLTYEQIFDNDRLPGSLIVAGGGPIGVELAQAYRRLGAQVTLIADRLLPRDEEEVRAVLHRVFEREGVRIVPGRAQSVRKDGDGIFVSIGADEVRGDLLLIACGRLPSVAGLDLEKAGVRYSSNGIPVDEQLRTNRKHIYAAGDVVGGQQFTHLAGWQAFQAARNALLPGSNSGVTDLVPWVTYTDPEIAHIGMTEDEARRRTGDKIKVRRWEMTQTDRAICDGGTDGFVKVVARKDGVVVGATVVHARAGETIAEFIVAIKQGMNLSDLAGAIHPYPSYSTAVQQLAAEMTVEGYMSGFSGRIIRGLSKLTR